jgi:hypothetical protein
MPVISGNMCYAGYVLSCSHTKKLPLNVYEKINKKYECIIYVVFYQYVKI